MWANWRDNIVLTSPYDRIMSNVVIMEHKRLQLQLCKSIWVKSGEQTFWKMKFLYCSSYKMHNCLNIRIVSIFDHTVCMLVFRITLTNKTFLQNINGSVLKKGREIWRRVYDKIDTF